MDVNDVSVCQHISHKNFVHGYLHASQNHNSNCFFLLNALPSLDIDGRESESEKDDFISSMKLSLCAYY
jgi:hypothetical protein